MSLKKAVPFLKSIAKTGVSSGSPSQYTFHNGYCHAQNPSILAAYPTPHILGTFGLAADGLEAALGRMPDEPTVGAGDEALILRSGRLRSTIKAFEALVPYYIADPEDDGWSAVPGGMIPAIRKANLFMSSRGTWQTSVRLTRNSVAAINDRSALVVDVDCPATEDPAYLIDTCVKYLDSQDDPDQYQVTSDSILFLWSSTGAWAKCQLSVYPWPDQVIDKIFQSAGADEPPVQLNTEWRDAFGDIVALSEDYVEVGPEGLKGVSENSIHEVPFSTGVSKVSKWSISVVKQLLDAAERWNPDASGPALFTGPSCRGVVVGRR